MCFPTEQKKKKQIQQLTVSSTVILSPSKNMVQWSRLHRTDGILMSQSFRLPTLFSPAFKTNVFFRFLAAIEIGSSRQLQFVDMVGFFFTNKMPKNTWEYGLEIN